MTAIHPNEPRPGSSSGFAFPRSGLGTPDFMCFGGSAGGTPSWYKQPKEPSVKQEEYDSDGALVPEGSTNASTNENTEERGGSDDGSRLVRAASDPPIRQTPGWLIPKSKLDQEPNPFEHSFSGKNPYEHFIPRRARSQSPKSSHGGQHGANAASLGPAANIGSTNSSNNIPVKLPPQGSMNTPSSEFANFGWALNHDSFRSGPMSSAVLNGPSAGYSSMFDPSSIRTGLTPSTGGGNHGTIGYTPHSPATQALFAMMTNATPGLPSIPKVDSDYSSSDNIENQRNPRSHSGSNSSGRSPHSNGHVHAQIMPKPLAAASIYGPRSSATAGPPPPTNHASQYAGYQSQSLLSQPAPRPLPAQVFRNSGAPPPGGAGPPPSQGTAPPSHFSNNSASQNPLFLLSQAQSQLNAVDTTEDDTVLAAAALSGLATPRPAYVGGPAPIPVHMQHAAISHLNPGGPSNINLQHPPPQDRRPAPAAKNASTASVGTAAKGKKAAGSNKRKKAESPAPAAGGSSKKPKRNTRRQAAAAQPIVEQDTFSDDDDNLLDMDDDMMSMNGSAGRSENGGNDSGQYGFAGQDGGDDAQGDAKNKGGRGPKQQFETEEEKRKNFLERNRQAALKCRQRKKQWLTQLQQKVESLTSDNEVLQQTCSHLREEVMTLRNILLSHKDCPIGNSGGANTNVTVGGLLAAQTHQNNQHQHQQQQQHRPY